MPSAIDKRLAQKVGRPSPIAKRLAQKAGLDLAHMLYRKNGIFYHILKSFPGAIFDENGYIKFDTKLEYEAFIISGKNSGVLEYQNSDHLNIRNGISSHKAYISFSEASIFPDELSASFSIIEGAKRQITVNRYERDTSARRLCIKKWGLACVVCDFNFLQAYGEIGDGFIHVHHLTPLASIKAEYVLVPDRDLRPVCPNCHAMLHRQDPPLTIDELRTHRLRKLG